MILVTTIRHLTQTTTVTRVIHRVSRQRSGDGFNPFWQHFLGPFLGPHGEGPRPDASATVTGTTEMCSRKLWFFRRAGAKSIPGREGSRLVGDCHRGFWNQPPQLERDDEIRRSKRTTEKDGLVWAEPMELEWGGKLAPIAVTQRFQSTYRGLRPRLPLARRFRAAGSLPLSARVWVTGVRVSAGPAWRCCRDPYVPRDVSRGG